MYDIKNYEQRLKKTVNEAVKSINQTIKNSNVTLVIPIMDGLSTLMQGSSNVILLVQECSYNMINLYNAEINLLVNMLEDSGENCIGQYKIVFKATVDEQNKSIKISHKSTIKS